MNHAWVEAHLPGAGWQACDPTNGCVPDERYVPVAAGRDDSDVAPIRGIYVAEAVTPVHMEVALDVRPGGK